MDGQQISSVLYEMSSTANEGQLEIFSRNSLTPMDLCSLAETCKRFKQVTQRIFSKGFGIKPCYSAGRLYTFSSKHHRKLEYTFHDIERILKNFGPHLSEFRMEGDLPLLNLITRYCDDITLKHFEMRDSKDTELVLAGLQLPILERFSFHSGNRKNNTEALSEFVRRHECLKSIEIYGDSVDYCKLLHAISCSCNELVELTLGNLELASFDISHLQNLAKLEALYICFYHASVERTTHCEAIDFSQAFKSLKTMVIFFGEGPYVGLKQIFDVLSQLQGLRELALGHFDLKLIPWATLTQLRTVYLGGLENEPYLLDVIRQLINLEELELKYYPLSREEFSKIVKIVESRAHVLTLKCDYDFIYEENCNEKGKVKLIKETYY